MPPKSALQKLFQAFPTESNVEDDPDNPAALPNVSLNFLVELAGSLDAKQVFEFGSGRSTGALLRAGCSVTSLEDSDYWMQQTVAQLTKPEQARHRALVRPLRLRFCGLIPVMDWVIDAELSTRLREADLILVDSPYFTPFRESTLRSALQHGENAVVVLDDVRIPTVRKFCDSLVAANPNLLHRRVAVGHTFDVFARLKGGRLHAAHMPVEILKGWRRFVLQKRLLGSGGSMPAA